MEDELYRPRRRREAPPTTSYFVMQGDEQFGPMTLAQLQGHFRAGNISAESLYWAEGMEDWRRLDEIREKLGLAKRTESESRGEKRQRLRERRARERKAAVRQTAFILLALFLLIAVIAAMFYFLGQMI